MLQKQTLNIGFQKGLDTKTDPWQVPVGNYEVLQNQVFTKVGRLTKRNGYANLSSLPDTSSTYLTTLNDNLTTIGSSIFAYNDSNAGWISKGTIQPMEVNTLPLIRNNLNQTQCDSSVSSNGLVCVVYSELNNSTTTYKYVISDSVTGQNIVAPTAIPVSSGVVTGSPRVFLLGNYFVIVFTNVITATSHLQYIAISLISPTTVTTNQDIASAYIDTTTLSWDGYVTGQNLYIAYNTTAGGQSIKVTYLTATAAAGGATPATPVTFATYKATHMTVTADESNTSAVVIWINIYRVDTAVGFAIALDRNLNTVLAPTATILTGTITNLASAAQNGVCTLFTEVSNFYSYNANVPSNYINKWTITNGGTVAGPTVSIRSVGLASKAFIVDGVIFYLSEYLSQYQPTYFLINGTTSTAASPVVVGKLAYQNGNTVSISSATRGYLPLGLPSVSVLDSNSCYVAYLFKDLISSVNKGTALPTGTQTAGVYSQTGINLGTFTIGTENVNSVGIGGNLLITGGFLWSYDGYLPVEQNFFLFPDNVEATWSATGGSMAAQPNGSTNTNAYYYQVVYEWTDNQGNAYRSAPSIPVAVTTTGSGSAGSIAVNVPTLRLTYKTANPVKIVIYRWSVQNQIYYQVTSLTAPTLNATTSDSISFTDTLADASIIGNNIIYTNGNVVPDINAPASNIFTLFDTRFWLVDAEDKNLLWFSKQVIEATPVEMSDFFTFYIAPTQAAQGSTGPITALAPLDDKLIIFKNNAIYYINGTGPDNTGANNQYSQPVFITSTVGCSNPKSIVFLPMGLMFQSEKGIWLLSRSLETTYIGAPVEDFNASVVQSAVNVPETNQVRFTLDTGQTLMYDYFVSQWGTFVGVPAISSCIFEGLHTFLNSYGVVYQESAGSYLDGSNPVLLGLTTGWLNLAGLQGYQRAYFFYLLGQYITPFKLQCSVAYDYNSGPSQSNLIAPTNYSPPYGGATPNPGDGTDSADPYGQGSLYGGPSNVFNWRIFLTKQRCQAFQITIQEVYDASYGVTAGAGLTLSGINLVFGVKKGFKPISSANSIGGGTR